MKLTINLLIRVVTTVLFHRLLAGIPIMSLSHTQCLMRLMFQTLVAGMLVLLPHI